MKDSKKVQLFFLISFLEFIIIMVFIQHTFKKEVVLKDINQSISTYLSKSTLSEVAGKAKILEDGREVILIQVRKDLYTDKIKVILDGEIIYMNLKNNIYNKIITNYNLNIEHNLSVTSYNKDNIIGEKGEYVVNKLDREPKLSITSIDTVDNNILRIKFKINKFVYKISVSVNDKKFKSFYDEKEKVFLVYIDKKSFTKKDLLELVVSNKEGDSFSIKTDLGKHI